MAEVIGTFDTGHTGPVHDTQLDYYGRRLATASSDHTIRIFDVSTDQPTFLAELRGHEGPVWQVCWAHPTFGSVLASCSYDKKVLVWKETQRSRWEIVYSCDDFSSSINGVCWCPWDFGLQFACAISDGSIAVCSYSPETRSWTKKQVFGHPNGANSVSWAPATNSVGSSSVNSSSQPIRLVSGGCDNQIRIWKQDPQTKELSEMNQTLDVAHSEWVRDVAWRPSVDLLAETIASCGDDKIVVIWTQDADGQGWHSSQVLNFNEPVWRVSWSVTGTVLAASSGEDVVTLFRENSEGKWEVLTNISGEEHQQQQQQQQVGSDLNNNFSALNAPQSTQGPPCREQGSNSGVTNAQTPSQFHMKNEDSSSSPPLLSAHGQHNFNQAFSPSQQNLHLQKSPPPPITAVPPPIMTAPPPTTTAPPPTTTAPPPTTTAPPPMTTTPSPMVSSSSVGPPPMTAPPMPAPPMPVPPMPVPPMPVPHPIASSSTMVPQSTAPPAVSPPSQVVNSQFVSSPPPPKPQQGLFPQVPRPSSSYIAGGNAISAPSALPKTGVSPPLQPPSLPSSSSVSASVPPMMGGTNQVQSSVSSVGSPFGASLGGAAPPPPPPPPPPPGIRRYPGVQ
ncbi:uncharacterized protein ELE39_000168 [Cryptosporidium sp. chipmunk genotype I]|uniref:uncharacterized protein n=1 Tax=Cryptosporidium sp. chipmunk genotype I TaxID=1280935 RepID=UPI00351A7682|nr:hypothetical protein ELE39_000168 [Cryptosporidium sp. chipmunk genotype I]